MTETTLSEQNKAFYELMSQSGLDLTRSTELIDYEQADEIKGNFYVNIKALGLKKWQALGIPMSVVSLTIMDRIGLMPEIKNIGEILDLESLSSDTAEPGSQSLNDHLKVQVNVDGRSQSATALLTGDAISRLADSKIDTSVFIKIAERGMDEGQGTASVTMVNNTLSGERLIARIPKDQVTLLLDKMSEVNHTTTQKQRLKP